MSKMKNKDKRNYKRSPIELAASYGIPEDDKAAQQATVVNLSAGGFCFQSRKKIAPGSNIKLTVQINPKKKVTIEVRCVWLKNAKDSGEYLVGVQVSNAETKDFDAFLSFYCDHIKNVS